MTIKGQMPAPEELLPGATTPIEVTNMHFVKGTPLQPPFPEGTASLLMGMGCFWGAERRLWQQEGIYTTAVGYAGGGTPNPSYEQVCSGRTGHTEVVLVVYEDSPAVLEHLLKVFWESHDPTQGMRQGNDTGTQYRSALYLSNTEQLVVAEKSREAYQQLLSEAGLGEISTELSVGVPLFYAEDYHQQYLAKNPNGYCGLAGTGVCYMT